MDIRRLNYRFGWLVADYLNENPCAVTPDLLRSVFPEDADAATEQVVYAALLGGLLGLDPTTSEEDCFLEDYYLRPGLQRLEIAPWRENPYYQQILFSQEGVGGRNGWALAWQEYQPYELFLRDDLILTDDLRQIPALGYFPDSFRYPSVLQDGREWMSIKPSEIASSQASIDAAAGRVVTFGLGLGYFAFMASRKPEVSSVTVVERDPSVIALFSEHILPQIPDKDKITVIQADAFDYLEHQMSKCPPDFVFMDIWHDIADGTPLYVRARLYETRFPHTCFMYWIERSLRCALVDELTQRAESAL